MFIGFSVIADPLYTALKLRTDADIDWCILPLGGNHFDGCTYLIDYMLETAKPDIVLLDIISTPSRRWAKEDAFERHIRSIALKILLANARMGFVHLFREDVKDYGSDPLIRICNDIARLLDVPVLDLCAVISSIADKKFVRTLLWDGVHCTPVGARLYADHICEFLESSFAGPRKELNLALVNYLSLENPVTTLTTFAPAELVSGRRPSFTKFDRQDFDIDVAVLKEEEEIVFVIPKGHVAHGIFLVHGPTSGRVSCKVDAKTERKFPAYDSFCYYERLVFHRFGLSNPRELRLIQIPGIPDVKLAKGIPNTGPRATGIAFITGSVAIATAMNKAV